VLGRASCVASSSPADPADDGRRPSPPRPRPAQPNRSNHAVDPRFFHTFRKRRPANLLETARMPTLASSSSKTLAALVARRSPTTTTGAPSARRLLHPSNSLPRFPIRAPIPVDASRICAPSAGPLGRSFASTTPPPPGGALPPNPPRLTTTTAGPSPISQTDPAALPELSTSSPLNRAVPPKRRSLIKRLLKATLWLNFGGFLLVVLGGGSLWFVCARADLSLA
jgi:hypothetical protein